MRRPLTPAPTRADHHRRGGRRDFHDFNVAFRDDPSVRVVAFTATQIPRIEGRRYPAALAGPYHPDGIPIEPEARLEALIADEPCSAEGPPQ